MDMPTSEQAANRVRQNDGPEALREINGRELRALQETGREQRLDFVGLSQLRAKINVSKRRSPMKPQGAGNRIRSVDQRRTRNPFDVMDVPNPSDQEVLEFATDARLVGTSDDENAKAWTAPNERDQQGTIEGNWSSRWNGGADPTIPGDAANKWKQGQAEVKAAGDRLYLLFDWDHGARRGLIDAHREGTRLVGKYINLTDPKVTRPWVGLIVSNQRIDGRWTGGRLDFRR
jgi:hypothetical protein